MAAVVAVGVAWHAGQGSWPGLPTNNANFHTIGIEAENNGTEGWSAAQYWAYVKCCAAICRKLGYGADRVIGHKVGRGCAGQVGSGRHRHERLPSRHPEPNQRWREARPSAPNQIDEMAKVAAGWIGARRTKGELKTPDGKGRYAEFERGYIYWHPDTGARPVPLNIFETWAGLGWEAGPLGYPTKHHAVVDKVGDIQAFQHGVIYRRYGQPGFWVHGVIGDSWFKRGAENSPLGWPTSNEYDFDGGKAQDFENDSPPGILGRGSYYTKEGLIMTVSTTPARLVFGREPAAWAGAIMAAVALLVAFGFNITTETQGLIQAAVNAVLSLIVVISVRETVLLTILGVVQTGLPLVVAFGFSVTEAQQGAILAAASLFLTLIATRPQVTPKVPSPNSYVLWNERNPNEGTESFIPHSGEHRAE